MKRYTQTVKRWLFVFLAALSLVCLLLLLQTLTHPDGQNNTDLSLQAPEFITPVEAMAADESIGARLDNEAGLSAYTRFSGGLDLNRLKNAYRSIEVDTGNYIMGTVSIPDYSERFDAHVYASQSGWMLAYYLQDDPISMAVDIRAGKIDTTVLHTAIGVLAAAAGMDIPQISLYDFRYPNATNLLLVYEDGQEDNEFRIALPGRYTYFERGYASLASGGDSFQVDDEIQQVAFSEGDYAYGVIGAASFETGENHTISVGSVGILAILYRGP